MGNIKDEVFLGIQEEYNKKLAGLAAMAQPEKWAFGKDKEKDPYRILRNYFQFTYNRLSEENKIIMSADSIFRCMNTGLLTVYNQEIVAIFSKNTRSSGLPWYFNGFSKVTDKFFSTKFSTIPPVADYCDNASDLIYDKNLDIILKKEHIIDDNYDRFAAVGYTEKQLISVLMDSALSIAKMKLLRNFKLALPFYYHNTETEENKMQLLVPLYFPGAPVRLALVLNKVVSSASVYYEGVTVIPVEWAYMNSRLICKPDEEWARIIDEADGSQEIESEEAADCENIC